MLNILKIEKKNLPNHLEKKIEKKIEKNKKYIGNKYTLFLFKLI